MELENSIIAMNNDPKIYGNFFDTISVCLSKGLGCPIGSVLVGKGKVMEKAIRIRKILGGGMRQVGYLAAAGLYACLLYTSPSPRDVEESRMPSSA